MTLSYSAVVLLASCVEIWTETKGIPEVDSNSARIYKCPIRSGFVSSLPSGGMLCFATRDVEIEVDTSDGRSGSDFVGLIVPVVPVPTGGDSPERLFVELAFKPKETLTFNPWEV